MHGTERNILQKGNFQLYMSAAHYTRKLTVAKTLNLALSPVTFHCDSYFNAILSPYTF